MFSLSLSPFFLPSTCVRYACTRSNTPLPCTCPHALTALQDRTTPIMEEAVLSPRKNFNSEGGRYLSTSEDHPTSGVNPMLSESVDENRVPMPSQGNGHNRTDANVTPLKLNKKDKSKKNTKVDGEGKQPRSSISDADPLSDDTKADTNINDDASPKPNI